MDVQMFVPIIYNGALLALLVLLLDIFSGEGKRQGKISLVANGLILGLICIAVMLNPWQATEGVVFDTRSVLLSITGLFFGLIPALVAGFLAVAWRVFQGGGGTVMGVSVIVSSITLGLLWRRRNHRLSRDMGLRDLFFFGLVVHFAMFMCAFALPSDVRSHVLSVIILPLFTVYPVITVLVGSMMSWSQRRVQVREALRESEEKYRLLADNTIDTIWMMGLDGRFQYLNSTVYGLLGYTSEEMAGRGLWEICDEENYRIVRREIDKLLADLPQKEAPIFEAELLSKEKRRVSVEITFRLVLDDKGGPVSLRGVIRDLSARKKIEAETERLRLAIEQTVESIMISDPEGIIVYVNPAFETTSGYSREEAVGQRVSMLESGKHPKDYFREMWETLRGGDNWSGVFINRKKDGTLYTEEASISPVFDAEGSIIYYIAAKRDVTYEYELEQQLRQSQKMEAVGQLAGGIAHDFNNILQAMMGYCEMLEESIEPDTEQDDFVQELRGCTDRAAKLVSQLLTFSRRGVIQPQNIDLNKIILGVLNLVERTIGEQIQLVYRLFEKDLLVHGDPGNIEQVLMNLCVNARDAMPDGGKLIIETSRIYFNSAYCEKHNLAEEGYYAVLQIKDTGCGMDEVLQDQIFEPFFTTKEVGHGTGLGLATAYGIISRHGGNIRVFSEKGKGTTFLVYLPLVDSAAEVVSESNDRKVGPVRETVLLAMNDPELRKMTKLILDKADYHVIYASDGEKAIDAISSRSDEIDIAVIDVVMPGKSGKEVLDTYRELKPDGRVLLVSGYSSEAMDVGSSGLDQADFISKPFSPGKFLRSIRDLLDR